MKAKRTPWWYYVIGALVGAILGYALVRTTRGMAIAPVGAAWFVSGLLLALGIVVLVMAWQVHRYVTGKVKTIDTQRAVTTLVLCKALAVAGAVLAGYYAGQLIMCILWRDVQFYHDMIGECIVACVVTVADMVMGIVGEWWCQLPPQEGPEHPNAKKRGKSRRSAAVAKTPRPADSADSAILHRDRDGA
ncbi:hypothetical protein PSRA_0651 [Pseudoscardovia radai]|uniref:DUF3180 domain-containing protein n=1 Tax=Pseudoscardovia radai TaxID=987066 RepID=A0A261EZ31_9BIFI|nr:DUF3180 domain-containing protein [Pseudoscardovia radai]OZG52101.1 hypothetical protein PSRA_0651 [Pseudoscardovia radai]